MSQSINIRDVIAARAEACVKQPPLVFDYDHQNNCEAFANLLTGAADTDSGETFFTSNSCCIVYQAFKMLAGFNILLICRRARGAGGKHPFVHPLPLLHH